MFSFDGFYIKELGRGKESFDISAETDTARKMMETGVPLNIHTRISVTGEPRHVSIGFREATESKFGETKTTESDRKTFIDKIVDIDPSTIKGEICGATVFGRPGNKFVVLLCHLGDHQEWFYEMRKILDKEWPGDNPMPHISTCLAYDPDTGKFTTRFDDVWGDEHDMTKKIIDALPEDRFFPDPSVDGMWDKLYGK